MITDKERRRYEYIGITRLEDMLELHGLGIRSEEATAIAGLGFESEVSFLRTMEQRFGGSAERALETYALAGFHGDRQAVLEMSSIPPHESSQRHRGYRVPPDYAKYLAEHGLSGSKEAMIEIADQVSDSELDHPAIRIAYRLSGKSYYRDASKEPCEEMERVGKVMASQIPARFLFLLATYDWREHIERDCKRESEISEVMCAAQGEAALGEASLQRWDFEDELLMKAFDELREHGEEAFKQKYMSRRERSLGYLRLKRVVYPNGEDSPLCEVLPEDEAALRKSIVDAYCSARRPEAEAILQRYGLAL